MEKRIVVGFNVRGADVKTVVETIQAKLDDKLKLPEGYYTTYGGQFENLIEANKRLSVAVPVALGLILVLLYFTFKSIKQSLLIFTAIPLSAIGGIVALYGYAICRLVFPQVSDLLLFWCSGIKRNCFNWLF